MKSLMIWSVVALNAGAVSTVSAQDPTRMRGFQLSASVGGAAFSALQHSEAEASWLTEDGQLERRQFARRLSAATAPVLAVGAAYWMNEHWGLRVQGGYAPTRLEVSVRDDDAEMIAVASESESSQRFRSLGVWSLDGQVLFRLPFTPRGRVAPYGFVGGGVLRYAARGREPLPPEAELTFGAGERPTHAAAVLGLGAIVPLERPNFALTFELSDRLTRTPVRAVSASGIQDGTVTVMTTPATDSRVGLTNHVRLQVGIAWQLR